MPTFGLKRLGTVVPVDLIIKDPFANKHVYKFAGFPEVCTYRDAYIVAMPLSILPTCIAYLRTFALKFFSP